MNQKQKSALESESLKREVARVATENRELREVLNSRDATIQLQSARIQTLTEEKDLIQSEFKQLKSEKVLAEQSRDDAVIKKTYCEGVIKGKDDMIEALSKLVTPR